MTEEQKQDSSSASSDAKALDDKHEDTKNEVEEAPAAGPEPIEGQEAESEPTDSSPETVSEEKNEEPKEEPKDFSYLKPGMTVKVHQKIQEDGKKKGETKERVQIFEGMILAIRGKGISKTITVRKVSGGVGVEKIFPLYLPTIVKIEPIKQAKVRRAKLYYLRDHKKRLKERHIQKEK